MVQDSQNRCKRCDIEGDAHHLTFSCFRCLPLFSRELSRLWMCDAIELGRQRGLYDLWAYVIMPEHVHMVLLPHPDVTMSRILTTVKQSVSKRAIIWLGQNARRFLKQLQDIQPNGKRSHRFWRRGGGYDRTLRTMADIYENIEYVHNNPVRRGLAKSAIDWSWSSCRAWESGDNTPIAIDRESLPMLMPSQNTSS
jgi:putative transposase